MLPMRLHLNTLRPRQNGRHFADDTFKRIFLKEKVRISIKISLKFVPKSAIDNIPELFQIMAWRRPGDKPLSEAMMVSVLTHICVARPQWVNVRWPFHRVLLFSMSSHSLHIQTSWHKQLVGQIFSFSYKQQLARFTNGSNTCHECQWLLCTETCQ